MFAIPEKIRLLALRAATLGLLVPLHSAFAQDFAADDFVLDASDAREQISFNISRVGLTNDAGGLIKVARSGETRDPRNGVLEDTRNFSLGLQASPVEGLRLDTNVWRSEFDAAPLQKLQNLAIAPNLRASGFDLGAAYAWNTNRLGQFTLSTRATYVRDFYETESLLESMGDSLLPTALAPSKLRGNLKLSWEFGNHTASAVTRYFDASRDLSELGMEEINDLVDNITTVDLEYGYRMAAGENDRAVISFGIQNVFDRKTMQILNSATRILDQNGRVAYGRLKYQF